MHGVVESTHKGATGRERWEWDMLTCRNIFSRLQLRITDENVKFCRRVGEKGGEARPLIVGLYNGRDRALLLSQDTRGTELSEISFGPDLTKEQRKEEADMRKEMEEKNRNLNEDEKAKNLAWRMVGPRGERRLVKGAVREQEKRREEHNRIGSNRGAISRGLSSRGPRLLPPTVSRGRGRGRIETRSRRGMEGTARGGGLMGSSIRQENSNKEDSDKIFSDALTGGNRERLASKRIREENEEDVMDNSEPPLKH